ncbi:MAG: discoidin domain-containing protein [Mycobacteriales bacterium]
MAITNPATPPHAHRRRTWRLALILAVLAALVGVQASPRPRAELFNPRQQMLRNSTAGLFLHWGMFTAPLHTDCAQWEADVTNGGWDPNYWPNEAVKLHASYLVLATFHSRLGYARPWPSKIPGSCATKRDFLGETIAAAKRKGLKVILYMTDDPKWHNEQGFETLDSAAFSAYAGHPVDLTTREGFGEYSYDLFFEVMQRYPQLGGFWIDNDNNYWERNGLYEQIRKLRPNYTLSNNNEDTPIMDMISNEQKTGMTPPYDYPQAAYTALPRLIEGDYKLPTGGTWWYDGQDRDVDYQLNIGRLVTNAGSSIKSLEDETAMVNGKFPPKQVDFNNFMNGYLDRIWDSLGGTVGGGYLYGGMQPGAWNDGAYGVVTVSKDHPDTQYLHVVTRPTGDTLKVRDAGYRVRRVTNLRTGQRLRFSQADGYLTVDGITDWDTYDTVLRVQTSGREDFYPQSSIRTQVSAAKLGQPGYFLTDGSYLNYWDNGGTIPVSITLDLGQAKKVASLALNQREWSVSYPRSATEDSARVKDYEVAVSDDGATWSAPVKTGTLPSARGIQFIDLNLPSARFVRLTVDSTWAAATATNFYHLLGIDEMYVTSGYVTSNGG